MSAVSLSPSTVCLRCCIRAFHRFGQLGLRHVSRTSAINRGLRATRSPPSSDRRRPERAPPSRRDRPGRGDETRSPPRTFRGAPANTETKNRRSRVRELDEETWEDRSKNAAGRVPKQGADRTLQPKSKSEDPARDSGTYGGWLATKRSEKEKRSQGIRARQEENYARKREQGQRSAGLDDDRKPEGRSDARESPAHRTWQEKARRRTERKEEKNKYEAEAEDGDDGIPDIIPYTTAESQFLYGTNPVLAALRARRRTLHCLHLRKSPGTDAAPKEVMRLAKTHNIGLRLHSNNRILDKMSENRPHNGIVLEVSPIPANDILAMGKVSPDSPNVPLYTTPLPAAERVRGTVDRSDHALSYSGPEKTWRKPFIVFLDGITDPGNVGSILRTAYFFGADAVAIATNTCANVNSPVLAKASAGACEAIPILSVGGPASFIHKSAEAGWKIYAAVAPELRRSQKQTKASSVDVSRASPLANGPVILMLGAEGEGLRENLRTKAHVDVSIQQPLHGVADRADLGVDSMNVGVAAGVLIDAFMRKPEYMPARADQKVEQEEQDEARENEKLF